MPAEAARVLASARETANNTARIESGNEQVAEQGLLSQRSVPTRQAYVNGRLAEWDASEGRLVRDRIAELEAERTETRLALDTARDAAAASTATILGDLRSERSRLQADLMQALADDRKSTQTGIELAAAMEAHQQLVSRLAGESVIYDIAAKVYGVPLHEVSEEQANKTTFWVVLGVALAAASSTGVAAFMATYLAQQKRTAAHVNALRVVAAKSQLVHERDRTIAQIRDDIETEKRKPPKIKYRDRLVYKFLPSDLELVTDESKAKLHSVKMETFDAA